MAFHKNLRGLDLHAPTNELVENQTTATIPKLKVVRLDGMGSVYPKIQLANPGIYTNFGIVSQDIPPGGIGYVTCLGFLFEVNTSPWPVGTELYSDAFGNLTNVANGGIVAQVVKQSSSSGVLYVLTEGNQSVGAVAWKVNGNNGTNENINFLGTVDSQDLRIKTDNLYRASFTKNGRFAIGPDLTNPLNHFHQKSHLGYTGSGLRQETYCLTTNNTNYNIAISIPIDQNSVVKVEFTAICRVSDGSGRAAFKRVGLFYREGGNVQAQGFWQTQYTEKSNSGFNVNYVMGISNLDLNVKSAVSTDTYWTGHVIIEAIKNNL